MKQRWVTGMREAVCISVGVSMLLSSCEVSFEPDIEPLVIEEAPGEAFANGEIDSESSLELESQVPVDPATFGVLDSSDAIAVCGEMELVGDSRSGSCLAPGGEAYYVWTDSDSVLLVARDDEHLLAFREAAEKYASSLAEVEELVGKWPELVLFGAETLAAGLTCGGAVAAGATGVGLVVSALLASGCVGSLAAFGYTGVTITQDAQALVESVNDVNRYENDAAYNFCRMEGKSDADCRG